MERTSRLFIYSALAVSLLAVGVFVREGCHSRTQEALEAAISSKRDSINQILGAVNAKDTFIAGLLREDSIHGIYTAELERKAAQTSRTVFFPVYREEVKTGGPADSILRLAVAEYRKRRAR